MTLFLCQLLVSATDNKPSARAFLFGLKNQHGTAPIKFQIRPDHREQAVRSVAGMGPCFGTSDLLFHNMSVVKSSLGTTYDLPANGAADYFVGETEFEVDDVEILFAGGNLRNFVLGLVTN